MKPSGNCGWHPLWTVLVILERLAQAPSTRVPRVPTVVDVALCVGSPGYRGGREVRARLGAKGARWPRAGGPARGGAFGPGGVGDGAGCWMRWGSGMPKEVGPWKGLLEA